jgi:hypothetical protein
MPVVLLAAIDVFTLFYLGLIIFLVFGIIAGLSRFSRNGKGALIDAIGGRDLHAINRIINNGINLNSAIHGISPLAWAFRRNDRSIIDLLIAKGASLSPDSPGNASLIIEAARSCSPELIDMALTAGHNIRFRREPGGDSVLEMAVRQKSPETIRYLFSKGAKNEDFRGTRWHTIDSATILTLLELGASVPDDIAAAVKEGTWK